MQVVDLEPGQFVFGRKAASLELNMSEQRIRTCLKKLECLQNISVKSTNKFSIISIINWHCYQQDKEINNQQSTNNQPTINQQLTTNKNDKNEKEYIHTSKKPNKKTPLPPNENEVVEYFIENGYSEKSAIDAFKYYQSGDWFDSKGNKVKNWKQKMRGVWFKDENLDKKQQTMLQKAF